MLKHLSLTLILGAIAPAYLQAGTSASANAAASAADVKSSVAAAADVKSSAAAAQKPQVPDNILPKEWATFGTLPRIDETHCQIIIDWIKEDPQNRKNAGCQLSGAHILSALYCIRFDQKIGVLQPALDFLISLKPETHSAAAPRKKSLQRVTQSSSFSLLQGTAIPLDPKRQNDFYRFVRQITRLMFLNGRNLLQIKDDAAYLKEQYEAKLQRIQEDYLLGGEVIQRHQNDIDIFEVALEEVETIREEAVARVALASSDTLKQVLLPELQPIVMGYATELTLDEARRALAELSAPQPQQSAQ